MPDWFVKGADEVVMVDATIGALLNRLKRGDIYATEKAQRAMENFFKESTLTALRELAYFFAPNINSYKRYQPGTFAPTAVMWGFDNRTCAIRVVGHGSGLRFENRVPGGDVNHQLGGLVEITGALAPSHERVTR